MHHDRPDSGYLITHLHVPHRVGPVHWGTDVSTIAGITLLSWIYVMPTLSRFCRPAERTARRQRNWYFLIPSVSIMVANLMLGVLGMFSQQAIGTWNVAVLGAHVSLWGLIAALGAVLGIEHIKRHEPLRVGYRPTGSPRHRSDATSVAPPAATIALGVIGIVMAAVGILDHAQTFANDVGSPVGPFVFVLIVDWYGKRPTHNGIDSYLRRRLLSGTWPARRSPWSPHCARRSATSRPSPCRPEPRWLPTELETFPT